MSKIMDLAAKREGATDTEKFLLDLYEALTRAIDGTVGDPIVAKLDLLSLHTELESLLWPELDEDDEESEEE